MTRYFHGTGERGPYFEGWYFKFQSRDGTALALIPAFHIDRKGRHSASLQILTRDGSWWLEYPETDFHAREDRLSIRMGKSVFTRQEVRLHVERDGVHYVYTPQVTERQYNQAIMQKKMKKTFGITKLPDFIAAFCGRKELTEEEAKKMEEMIRELEDD